MAKGLIVNNISNTYTVKKNEDIYTCTAKGKLKNDNIIPTVGDNAIFDIIDETKKEGIITEILERSVYLKRPKVANITQIMLVISIKNPKPDLLMLDKQIVFAEFLKIEPIIIINKRDLDENNYAEKIKDIYSKIGYKVIITEGKNGVGITEVKKKLKNNITVFSGNSGVGKSTIINSILGKEITKEGKISEKNQKGKNTTTVVTLYEIDANSYIVDTPGFSSFDITEVKCEDLKRYFIEFNNIECEFLDCSHTKERNCKVLEGVKSQNIVKQRYENYCKLYEYLKDKEENLW